MVDGDADDTSHSKECNKSDIGRPSVSGSFAQPNDARNPHTPLIENMRYLFQLMKNLIKARLLEDSRPLLTQSLTANRVKSGEMLVTPPR